jgi:uncharacterized membrane protein
LNRNRYIAQAGVIAAVYAALTIVVVQVGGVFSYGPLQLRPSEAVVVLAALTPAAIPGLWLGAMLANGFTALTQTGALGLLDVVLGGLGTLLGAWWTWRFRRNTPLALFGPVLTNALIVPAYLPILAKAGGFTDVVYKALGVDATHTYLAMYLFGVVGVALGEAVVVYGLGWPLLAALRRLPVGALMETPGSADDKGVRDA